MMLNKGMMLTLFEPCILVYKIKNLCWDQSRDKSNLLPVFLLHVTGNIFFWNILNGFLKSIDE